MNKQPTTIRAYLLRGAFLLSLAFVIVMPLALGQTRSRGSKPSVAAAQMPQVAPPSTGAVSSRPGSQLPTSGPTGVRSLRILPQPTLPSVVLYDQYDNDLNNGIVSANRTDNSSLSAEAADNFVVPGGQTWTITEVDIRSPVGFPTPTSFAVNFYTDNGSGLPGTQVYTASGLAVTGNPDYVITLTTPAVLSSGTYWVSAVGTITGTNWYWEGRSVTSNGFATAWRNPGGGYGLGCTDWARLQDCIGFSWPDQMFRIVGTTGGGTPTPTPTPTATPTPGPCTFQVLIAYADIGGQPTVIQNEILAEPGVTAVDLFDAFSGTPTLAQLQQYNIVFAFSNNFWNDAVAMGNVLADYEDAGGVVVVGTFAWDNRGGWNLAGRWMTGGYTPYNSTSQTNFSDNTANITDPSHPLMQGVSSLSAFYRNGVTLTAGAVSVADWTDGPPAVAYKANNGHTAVGINAYLGYLDAFSGEWGRVIVNAGRWLIPCATPTPTPTPTQIVLTASAHRVNGRKVVNLTWTGANSARVDIYRDGAPLARVPNSGTYTDVLTHHGTFTYKVCEAGTANCSNEVTVRFGGGP